jgi:hypothetical protein
MRHLLKENEAAINKIMHKLVNIYAYRYKFDKEDLYQQAWVIILDNINKFDPEESALTTFIYMILYRNLWTYALKIECPVSGHSRRYLPKSLYQRYTPHDIEADNIDHMDQFMDDCDYEDLVSKIELYKRMYKRIKSSYKGDAAYDFIVNGTDIEAISEYTGLAPATIWVAVARARQKVKKDLTRIKREYDAT